MNLLRSRLKSVKEFLKDKQNGLDCEGVNSDDYGYQIAMIENLLSEPQPSEISDNEAAIEMLDEAWNIANSAYEYGCECGTPDGELRCKHCNIGIKADNLKHKAIELLRTTPEPVSVSLEKCTKAVNSVPINRSVSISDCQDMAKAVLDAAGVKYVG